MQQQCEEAGPENADADRHQVVLHCAPNNAIRSRTRETLRRIGRRGPESVYHRSSRVAAHVIGSAGAGRAAIIHSAARREELLGQRAARADEDDLGDGGGLEDFGAECAGGVARGFLGEMRDLLRGEGDGVEVGAAGVGIFAVARAGLGCFGEIHQDLPEGRFVAQGAGDFLQRIGGFGDGIFCDAERMARGRAAGFEDYL